MSTEHQQYSIDNQSQTIQRYAEEHGMTVVRTYSDAGKSGLTVAQRVGLRQLIADVEGGSADFAAILVYDVSRWGRFQDADESAYYEYRCRRANIHVHYCAEPFANDGTLPATLLKTIKRTMAGEYSRELSAKVFAGKARLVELGFRQGGGAGYGFRRLLLDKEGNPKGVLRAGEYKNLFTDRVILIPGPDEEIRVVREVFERFVTTGDLAGDIARWLNQRGVPSTTGGPWSWALINYMLGNPKYIGDNVTNRHSFKLQKVRVQNPPEMWIRRKQAFAPIIPIELFERAQAKLAARKRSPSDEELLKSLRELLARNGKLSIKLIRRTTGMPSTWYYDMRFKSVLNAYERIGYVPNYDFSYLGIKQELEALERVHLDAFAADLKSVGATVQEDRENNLFTVNREFTLQFFLVRCRSYPKREFRWIMRPQEHAAADIAIAARMAPGNTSIMDYYVFPNFRSFRPLNIGIDGSFITELHRFEDLSFVKELARPQTWKEEE